MNEKSKQIDRQTLYEQVWSEPVTVVANSYGLSDVGLAKICRKLCIPLPGRGYWAKVKAGKIMGRARLPTLGKMGQESIMLTKLDSVALEARTVAKQQAINTRAQNQAIVVPAELSSPHPLIRDAAKRLKQREGWSDEKGLRSAPAEVLHLEVTRSALDRSLLIMDTLLKALAVRSISARVDAQSKQSIIDIEGTPVAIIISEQVKRSNHEETPAEKKAREQYWNRSRLGSSISYPVIPRFDYHPTGLLTIKAGQWPSRTWNDTPRTTLENRLGEVIAGIVILATEIRATEAEEIRRRDKRQRAEERYAFLKNRRDTERSKLKQLETAAIDWERATRLRAYIDATEHHALTLGEFSPELQDWVAWARAKADALDPLIAVYDLILDAPEPKPPGYGW
jgi:hypothetical protein